MRQKRRIAALVCLLLLLGAACTQKKVNEAQVGVYYTDGWIEGQKFDHVMQPGDKAWVWNDNVYLLPARQVTFISAAGEEADAPPLKFRTSDGAELEIELATRFFLNSESDTIEQFFLEICQKFNCWDGATAGGKVKTNDGWGRMLRETIGNPQQAVARDVGLDFKSAELRYNNETRDSFAKAFGQGFADIQKTLLGGNDYFCGPGYKRGEADCPNIAVEVTGIRYTNGDLETQLERRELAAQQEQTAVAEERAAEAQQRVNAAKATQEFETLQRAQALRDCAKNPQGCSLTIIIGDESIPITVPTG